GEPGRRARRGTRRRERYGRGRPRAAVRAGDAGLPGDGERRAVTVARVALLLRARRRPATDEPGRSGEREEGDPGDRGRHVPGEEVEVTIDRAREAHGRGADQDRSGAGVRAGGTAAERRPAPDREQESDPGQEPEHRDARGAADAREDRPAGRDRLQREGGGAEAREERGGERRRAGVPSGDGDEQRRRRCRGGGGNEEHDLEDVD